MLTHMRLKNFKAWRDTGDVPLAPLTILFGANSSGKSSLHQFLLMLRQTVESPDRRRVLHTGDSTTPVDLGSYSELIRDGEPANPLEFELGWRRSEKLRVLDSRTERSVAGRDLAFRARIGALGEAPPRVRVENYRYSLQGEEELLELGSRLNSAGKYEVEWKGIDLVRTLGRKWPVSPPAQFHAFPDDLTTRFQNVEFAPDLVLAFEEQLASLNYLGPLREKPGRLYRWSGEEISNVGWRGERTVEALLAGATRRYNRKPGAKHKALQELVAEWLKKLGVINSFALTPIGVGRDEYEVRVIAPGSRSAVPLTSVGFGVSQVLPVIAEAFYSAPGSTVIMEQPEIHLHPSVQAGLADLFIDAIRMRESGQARNVQFVIESHSEHMLRRLLRRIAEGEVQPEEIRCYVVSNSSRGSRIEPLEVDEFGDVHNWPDDFFGNSTEDIVAQSKQARARRRSLDEVTR
jgi:predicted ATPase